jgi:hypothetical protein
MTLLVSWIGIDTHGPTSAYIVGDSRFSWNRSRYFDYGKKIFSSSTYPEIFGYAGDILFPSTVLSQIIEMIDSNIFFNESMNCDDKNKLVVDKLEHSFSQYPTERSADNIQILHISRDTIFERYPKFSCYFIHWNRTTNRWEVNKIDIPIKSGILCVLGSGKIKFCQNYKKYQSGLNQSTSRNVFHCFIDTLFNIQDQRCGGPPQLVGIYRKPKSTSMNFGILYNDKRYFLGAEVPDQANYLDRIEWRTELFELCDGREKKVKATAMRQPDSLRRK